MYEAGGWQSWKLEMRLGWYTAGNETRMVYGWEWDYNGIQLGMRLEWYMAGDQTSI